MFLSKIVANLLFGKFENLEGKLCVRESLSTPRPDGTTKTFYWEGNKGLIITMLEKIEKLEEEVSILKTKKTK